MQEASSCRKHQAAVCGRLLASNLRVDASCRSVLQPPRRPCLSQREHALAIGPPEPGVRIHHEWTSLLLLLGAQFTCADILQYWAVLMGRVSCVSDGVSILMPLRLINLP